MTGVAKFRVEAGVTGADSIVINGEEVGDRVQAVDLQVRPGGLTVLTVHHVPGAGTIEGEGIVRVASDTADISDADVILGFLGTVDARLLSKQVLESAEYGGMDPIQSAVELLKAMARDY